MRPDGEGQLAPDAAVSPAAAPGDDATLGDDALLLAEDDDDILQRARPAARRRARTRTGADQGRGQTPGAEGRVGSGEMPAAPASADELDEADAALLAEDDDDILQRRRVARDPVPGQAQPQSRKMTKGERAIIAAGAIVGILLGVWFAGRPSAPAPQASAEASTAMGTGMQATDNTAQISALRGTIAQNPEDAAAQLKLGILLLEDGDDGGAKEHLTIASRLDPKNAEPWYYLGFYHLSQDPPDYDAAKGAWDKVIALEPDSDLAKTVATHIDGLMTMQSAMPTGSS